MEKSLKYARIKQVMYMVHSLFFYDIKITAKAVKNMIMDNKKRKLENKKVLLKITQTATIIMRELLIKVGFV